MLITLLCFYLFFVDFLCDSGDILQTFYSEVMSQKVFKESTSVYDECLTNVN